MLTENRLRKSIHGGTLALGLVSALPLPSLVEMVGYAGYDFVILDQEHAHRVSALSDCQTAVWRQSSVKRSWLKPL